MHAECDVPAGTKDFLSYFLCLTKSMESRGAAKEFKFVCAKLFFGWADSSFGKPRSSFLEGFNFVREKPPLRRAESRFGKPRNSRQGSTGCYFVRRAKSNIKSTRDSVLRPAIQSSIEVDFSRVFRRHEPNPVFRTKRRRKGFESVRHSGVTA